MVQVRFSFCAVLVDALQLNSPRDGYGLLYVFFFFHFFFTITSLGTSSNH
jgi:hypothetical protein